jgi:broad specificity phosphatase PhoE
MHEHIPAGRSFFIIRHATPDWSRSDLPYHKVPGPPLTEHGQAEAEALGTYLSEAGVHYLYSSPLERCEHTARIISECTGAPLQIEARLIEWQPHEKPDDVRDRMLSFLDEIDADGQRGSQIGLVTHGGPIAMLLTGLGMDDVTLKSWRKFDHANPAPPAGVWRAKKGDVGAWDLELIFEPSMGAYDKRGVTRVSPSQYKA